MRRYNRGGAAYTILNHGGDFTVAARALADQHEGDRLDDDDGVNPLSSHQRGDPATMTKVLPFRSPSPKLRPDGSTIR